VLLSLAKSLGDADVLARDVFLEIVGHGLEEVSLGTDQVDVVEVLVVSIDLIAEVGEVVLLIELLDELEEVSDSAVSVVSDNNDGLEVGELVAAGVAGSRDIRNWGRKAGVGVVARARAGGAHFLLLIAAAGLGLFAARLGLLAAWLRLRAAFRLFAARLGLLAARLRFRAAGLGLGAAVRFTISFSKNKSSLFIGLRDLSEGMNLSGFSRVGSTFFIFTNLSSD
jgi:hypothetical protein